MRRMGVVDRLFYLFLSRSSKLRYLYKLWLSAKAIFFFIFFKKSPMPGSVVIDPGNVCNLRCPLCLTGSDRSDYPKGLLTFEGFKTLVGRVGKIRILALYFQGEPFLNPAIFEMISYARERQIVVLIHSNFSFKKDDAFFDGIVASGLDVLSISYDGVSQACYGAYRRGGDAALVKSNLLRLLAAKKRLKSRKPFIVWQYLYSRFNMHEIAMAKAEAKALGVRFYLVPLRAGPFIVDLDDNDRRSDSDSTSHWHDLSNDRVRREIAAPPNIWKWTAHWRCCEMLFSFPFISWDGGLFACCLLSKKTSLFGNLYENELSELWNGKKYHSARMWQIYRNKAFAEENSVCLNCPLYGWSEQPCRGRLVPPSHSA
jgi:radical SAM protein with 4Fe4S-binding SPASM domain